MKAISIKIPLIFWKLLAVACSSLGAVYLLSVIPGTAHLSLAVNGLFGWLYATSVICMLLYIGDLLKSGFYALTLVAPGGFVDRLVDTVGCAICVTIGVCFTAWLVPGSVLYSSASGVLQLTLIICAAVNLNSYFMAPDRSYGSSSKSGS